LLSSEYAYYYVVYIYYIYIYDVTTTATTTDSSPEVIIRDNDSSLVLFSSGVHTIHILWVHHDPRYLPALLLTHPYSPTYSNLVPASVTVNSYEFSTRIDTRSSPRVICVLYDNKSAVLCITIYYIELKRLGKMRFFQFLQFVGTTRAERCL